MTAVPVPRGRHTPGGPGTPGDGFRAGRGRLTARADGYGCHVELRVEHAAVVTAEELDRALAIACEEARARFRAPSPGPTP